MAFYYHGSRVQVKSILILILISWLRVRYQDIKTSTSKQERLHAGIFFLQKIESELFMRFNTVYMAYMTYLIVQICFQNFMPLKRIVFQRQGKVFLKKHKNLAMFPHICLKASTFTDKRQKSGKKTFLLFRSNIGIHDFVKIRRMFTNFFYFFLNLDTSMHKHKIKVY